MAMRALLTLAALTATLATAHSIHDSGTYFHMFQKFKTEYKKHYNNADAEAAAFGHFAYNMREAAAQAVLNPHAEFGFNEFSDMSEHQFKSFHNAEHYVAQRLQERQKNSSTSGSSGAHAHERVAEALGTINVDWRARGVVTSVKNQGGCGDCWAFSAAANIEGQWALAGHGLVSLSPQQLCSCDTNDGACGGGLMDNAFNWLVSTQGGWITSDAAYPYTSGTTKQRGTCQANKPRVAQITGHTDVAANEAVMASWVAANGPLSVAIASPAWQSYRGGILTNCGAYGVDHGVLVVGVNTVNNPPYWIIKNSWGAGWGEQGYIRVAYGSNQCRITTIPSSAIVPRGAVVPPPPPPVAPNPPPVAPNPPAPAPQSGSFIQYQCASTGCSSGCSPVTYAVGQCLPYSGGKSAKVSCSSTSLVMTIYNGGGCTGTYTTATQPLNACLAASATQHFYNTCRVSAEQEPASSGSSDAPKLLAPEH